MANLARARNYLFEMSGFGYKSVEFEQFKGELSLTDARARIYVKQLITAGLIEKVWLGKIYLPTKKTKTSSKSKNSATKEYI
jgi:predicted DNA-binding transcriptional regulator